MGAALDARRLASGPARVANPGFGWCLCCFMPWNLTTPHSTNYAGGSGCFPLCEDCWRELATPEARMPYYDMLLRQWMAQMPGPDHNGVPWAQVGEAFHAAVLEGK